VSYTVILNNVFFHGHRDIANEPELAKPTKFVGDVDQGIRYVRKDYSQQYPHLDYPWKDKIQDFYSKVFTYRVTF
jgi:hypothetical protein